MTLDRSNTWNVVVMPVPAHERDLLGREKVAARSAAARVALRASADVTGATLGRLDKDDEDAPLPSDGWHWSISHGGGFVAGVVCRSRVGVDVEEIVPRRNDLVPRVTSREELELLGGFSWEVFARVWTAKEAVLKKAGCGILELSRCVLVAAPDAETLILHHRERDHVVHQRSRARHVASVTFDTTADASVAWRWHGEFATSESAT